MQQKFSPACVTVSVVSGCASVGASVGASVCASVGVRVISIFGKCHQFSARERVSDWLSDSCKMRQIQIQMEGLQAGAPLMMRHSQLPNPCSR